ncbi:hypothetical protein NSK_004809 [Nannochloropsis salina CCMP1776]|uniref:Uncharacterized protein n=1 Tax=Nannochloropsis salina CCMP1776 TaxID=1027361 RepID=A0A4D9D2M8_9STRA|nr:hypothetical protein NSK_004809 [Nannochloropsis salina CCMP1776]|eukprot:TFJ83705.1 hypothetical protein NSK_004809 [Nannochloropsis salina CCMP1776]
MTNSGSRKIVLLTGSTGAIGREIAISLAGKGCELILPVRDIERGNQLVKDILDKAGALAGPVHLEACDMSSLSSLRNFVGRVQEAYPRLDVLINNAATVPPTRQLTEDGLETQFCVNVLSYFLLMFSLSSFLRNSGKARIINVASNLAGDLDLTDMQFEKRKYNNMLAYKQSKQADRQLTWAGAKFFADSGVKVFAMHPGVTTSAILKGVGYEKGWDSAEFCAKMAVQLVMEEEGMKTMETGTYWVNGEETACPWQENDQECQAVWDYCKKCAGVE